MALRRCLISGLALVAVLLPVGSAQAAQTFTVDNTGDTSAQACTAAAGDCSLRSAIEKANGTAGVDTINFASGVTAHPLSVLPIINEAVTIDGNPSGTGPDGEIDGSGAGSVSGLVSSASGTVIRDISIWGFNLSFQVLFLTNGQISSSYIGLKRDGTTVPGPFGDSGVAGSGGTIVIGGAAAGDGNVIAGQGRGIDFTGSSTGVVDGNLIGVNKNGANPGIPGLHPGGTGNTDGILFNNTGGHSIGTNAGNVISGNDTGINAQGGTGNNTILNNLVGTNAAGTAAVPNGIGINLADPGGDQVGQAGGGNVVSGNLAAGIATGGASNTFEANVVGLRSNQSAAVPNGSDGISITAAGTVVGPGNVVAGNDGNGISTSGSGSATIRGNRVGVNTGGTVFPNTGQAGVYVQGNSSAVIGGLAVGQPNLIVGNSGTGIRVDVASVAHIQPNSVFANGGLGIDLGGDGVDGIDGAGEPDAKQNYPTLTSASTTSSATSVAGTLVSTPSRSFRIDYYASSACDPLGNGEGQTYLGSQVVSTDGSGTTAVGSPSLPPVGGGQVATATASDLTTGETSEFSVCRAISGPPATGGGGGGGGGTPPPPDEQVKVPKPVAGKSVNIEPAGGRVTYKCKGDKKRRLEEAQHVLVGCLVDARKGKVRLIAAANRSGSKTKSAIFYDGQFTVREKRSSKPITELRLAGKLSCKTVRSRRAVSDARRKRRRGRGRRLWGRGRGRFRSRGRRSSATVRGTTWLVQDRCDGSTLTKVRKGKVAVRDFGRRKTVIVRARHSYVAKARR